MVNRYLRLMAAATAMGLLMIGCATAPVTDTVYVDPAVEQAEALFEQGLYSDAIIACTDIHRKDPLTPGLPELQVRIMRRLAELRQRDTTLRDEPSDKLAIADLDRQGILPDTYRQRRHVVGESQPIATLPTEMQAVMQRPISIHLENVNLSAIVAQIGASENVNIVSDDELSDKTMTVHIDNTPLSEVLEYVGRNMGVTFAVGQNIIWVTQGNESAGKTPLVSRIYRLRKGLSREELEGGPDSLGIIDAVTRFVPEIEGSDILFNTKAHAILVKNSRENIRLIEDIIEVLDIRPPQVLIESRFISTGVTDLRELGLDWVLNSDIGIGNKAYIMSGGVMQANRSQINRGATLGFTEFPNANHGLNLTFEGLLTKPEFSAMVHVLEASGKSRTLSVPRVTTVNNREASVRVGEDFRFFEQYQIEEIRSGTTESGRDTYESRLVPTGTPTLEELGIELIVTPSVGADLATISLALAPEISEFVRWEYYESAAGGSSNRNRDEDERREVRVDEDGNVIAEDSGLSMIKLPVFRRSKVETEVQVRSGETVVMGGMVTSSRVKRREGIPFLSKIPWIGQLFRHDIYENVSQNLLIFVTATLISDEGEELIPITPREPVTGAGKVLLGEAEEEAPQSAEAAPTTEGGE